MNKQSLRSADTRPDSLELAREWIGESERLLITAGAGLTAAAGIDYADTRLFAREFPAMLQYGFTSQYQLMGFNRWPPELQWGYLAANIELVRFRWPETEIYQQLRRVSTQFSDEQTFVTTSNVDAMFERNGFDPNRVYTPQGDYAYLQCTVPCSREVWPWYDQIKAIRRATDPETQLLTDRALIPACPNCGEPVFPNVRIYNSFIGDHLEVISEECRNWVEQGLNKRGVILEIGAGFSTPSVIRWPNERIVHFSPDWRIIRINRDDSRVPDLIEDRAVCISDDVGETLERLVGGLCCAGQSHRVAGNDPQNS